MEIVSRAWLELGHQVHVGGTGRDTETLALMGGVDSETGKKGNRLHRSRIAGANWSGSVIRSG